MNNNEDVVRLTHFYVKPGEDVRVGDSVADVETDKATFNVEATDAGTLLGFCAEIGDTLNVGSILAWIGAPGEPMPASSAPAPTIATTSTPTLKAALLLAQNGLTLADVPASGDRLTAEDVTSYLKSHGAKIPQSKPSTVATLAPSEPGQRLALTPPEQGMLRTVSWQKNEAVPGYLELAYNPKLWADYAAEFQAQHKLLMSPLLALMSWQLTRAVVEHPAGNATIADGQRHQYTHVNLGFTVQAGSNLIVVVIREAETLDQPALVKRLGELQRSATKNTLRPDEVSGATVGFSSMGRWPVTRHVPVLLPLTSLMIAHTAPIGETATLGVTYDHRVLNGANAVNILQKIAAPPDTV